MSEAECDPRIDQLAEETGLCPKRIERALHTLAEQEGLAPDDALDIMLFMGSEIKDLVEEQAMPSQELQ